MKLSAQQALLSARNVASLVAAGGRVAPRHLGEDWSDYQNVWDCRNAVLHNSNYRHVILTTLNTHRKEAWLPVEREMQRVAEKFFQWKQGERRLAEVTAEDSMATPKGVLRVAHEVDRLARVYEESEEELARLQEAVGWELFLPPRMVYSWML